MALSTPTVDQLFGGLPASQRLARFEAYKSSMSEKINENLALEAVTQEIERDLKKLGVAGFESIMNLLVLSDQRLAGFRLRN